MCSKIMLKHPTKQKRSVFKKKGQKRKQKKKQKTNKQTNEKTPTKGGKHSRHIIVVFQRVLWSTRRNKKCFVSVSNGFHNKVNLVKEVETSTALLDWQKQVCCFQPHWQKHVCCVQPHWQKYVCCVQPHWQKHVCCVQPHVPWKMEPLPPPPPPPPTPATTINQSTKQSTTHPPYHPPPPLSPLPANKSYNNITR